MVTVEQRTNTSEAMVLCEDLHPLLKVYDSHFVVFCQTAEEIEQLTVDEDLNDIERAVYLLR